MGQGAVPATDRAAFLLDVGRRLAASLEYEETARSIVALVVPRFADFAGLHVLEKDGGIRLLASSADDTATRETIHEYLQRYAPRMEDERGTGAVLRTGQSQVHFSLTLDALRAAARDPIQLDLLTRLAPRSNIIVPLRARDRTLGALSLVRGQGSPEYTPEDVQVAEDLASRAALALDSADLYRAERAAREEAERVSRLLQAQNEAAPDGIFFQASDGTTAWYNQRLLRMWDVDSSVTEGATVNERLAAVMDRFEDPEAFTRLVMAMEKEPDSVRRFDVRAKGGKTFDCFTAPVTQSDGARLGRVWYYRDVTAQRAMEAELGQTRQQLAQSEKLALIGTLVSGVAHEIRTPLAYVNNHAHLMQRWIDVARARGPGNLDALDASARSIAEGVDRMNRLVVELRRFVRKDEPAAVLTDVDDAARGAVNLFTATHRGRALVESAYGHAGSAFVDKTQLQQVVLNLLENAVEASPPGARVRLATRATQEGPEIVVRDWGPGIPQDVAARMWEPFFTTKKEGTGLGLSIVRRIVEAAGGTVACESAPGQGASFVVRLPAASPPSP